MGTQFGTVSVSNGAFTPVGTMGSASGITVGGSNSLVLAMAWDAAAGNFLVSVDQAHGNAPSKLVRVDPATGQVVPGAFGARASASRAVTRFDPEGRVLSCGPF